MNQTKAAVVAPSLERAVFVEACDSGWDPQTVVRHLVWYDGRVHEELQVFPSLREALAYAQRACVSPDGPRMARH
jgi:hypothetical protein